MSFVVVDIVVVAKNERRHCIIFSPRFVVIPPRPCLFAAAFFLRRALAIFAAAEDLKTLPWAIGFPKSGGEALAAARWKKNARSFVETKGSTSFLGAC